MTEWVWSCTCYCVNTLSLRFCMSQVTLTWILSDLWISSYYQWEINNHSLGLGRGTDFVFRKSGSMISLVRDGFAIIHRNESYPSLLKSNGWWFGFPHRPPYLVTVRIFPRVLNSINLQEGGSPLTWASAQITAGASNWYEYELCGTQALPCWTRKQKRSRLFYVRCVA